MAATQGPSASCTQEYTVRVPRDRKKHFSMLKYSSDIDFIKLGQTPVKLERENNLKEYKSANDLDQMPKFGAGSEYGREFKEEARRKKYGIMLKKYRAENQPWIMKIGMGRQCKKYKGVREGTIDDNTSYYIFTQCQDGAFDAFPVEQWYNFSPVIKYKYLNSDEAEEEFKRRDKTFNLFSVMMRKKLKNEDKEQEPDEGEQTKAKTKGKSKKDKDFYLTDLDEWAIMSDEDEEEDADEEHEASNDDEKAKKPKEGAKPKNKENKKKKNTNSDDEAVEESDEGDYDDREVDYMTDSASSLSDPEEREKMEKYEQKGVDEEDGLRKLIDSEASSEEEENKIENEDDNEKDEKFKKDSESDSSSSSLGSESDLEKDEGITSALFMQISQKQQMSKESKQRKLGDKKKSSSGPGTPRSVTPTLADQEGKKGHKRKIELENSSSKRVRTDSPVGIASAASEGITEEAIRRYLMRKPMTTKDLLQKFKSKKLNMTNEQVTTTIVQLLRKINPDKHTINKTLYLSLKKPD